MEYIRDVYAELVAMGEGGRRPGDRSDISSDEEDEMEVGSWVIRDSGKAWCGRPIFRN